MKRIILLTSFIIISFANVNAQTNAMQFSGVDCNGSNVDLFADLDAGKAVVLFYYMANCGSCPPKATLVQKMANKINTSYPGMVKAYAFPYTNSTTCAYSSSWVNQYNLPLYTPMDSGATQVAYYGGFGMPTVVLVGGLDHRVMFTTQSFITSDTTLMRDSILALLGTTALIESAGTESELNLLPNPANDQITVELELTSPGLLTADILDSKGSLALALISNRNQSAGIFREKFDISALPAGNYIFRLMINGRVESKYLNIIR